MLVAEKACERRRSRKPIPGSRRPHARYCSKECQQTAREDKQRERRTATTKRCANCGGEFTFCVAGRGQHPATCGSRCKAERKTKGEQASRTKEKERYKETNRRSYLRKKFGITPEQYDALLVAQGGGCGICGRTPEEEGRNLAVDHDHACCPGDTSCGKCIRGLLCGDHNQALGKLGDTIEGVTNALAYLLRAEG